MLPRPPFARVEVVGGRLPEVEVATAWGKPALKVRGKMFACLASHRSAEPDTLVVMMEVAARDALLADDPVTYYLTPHYVDYPCVLVRLSRVSTDALRDLLGSAHRFAASGARRGKRGSGRARPRSSRSSGSDRRGR